MVATTIVLGGAPQRGSAASGWGLLSPDPVAPVTLPAPGVVITPGQDVPDPFVIEVAGVYFMATSQDQFYGPNVPMMVSPSLTSWTTTPFDAMPQLPTWAVPGFTWSPDIREVGGRYVLWFNASVAGTGFGVLKCIGVATADSVEGPYVSSDPSPKICQRDHLGSIDPRTFLGPDGRLWLLWKSDDNADLNAATHSTIYIQQLSSDGLNLIGTPTELMSANLPWEGRIVESPDMVYAGGRYWLFFSGNWFNQPDYGVGVAQCDGPTGPCVPTTIGPWLSSNFEGAGPGEESIFFDGSRWWILYAPFAIDYQTWRPRPAVLARLTFGPDGPAVVAPGTPAWNAGDPPSRSAPSHSACSSDPFGATCAAARYPLSGVR